MRSDRQTDRQRDRQIDRQTDKSHGGTVNVNVLYYAIRAKNLNLISLKPKCTAAQHLAAVDVLSVRVSQV